MLDHPVRTGDHRPALQAPHRTAARRNARGRRASSSTERCEPERGHRQRGGRTTRRQRAAGSGAQGTLHARSGRPSPTTHVATARDGGAAAASGSRDATPATISQHDAERERRRRLKAGGIFTPALDGACTTSRSSTTRRRLRAAVGQGGGLFQAFAVGGGPDDVGDNVLVGAQRQRRLRRDARLPDRLETGAHRRAGRPDTTCNVRRTRTATVDRRRVPSERLGGQRRA